MSCDLDPLRYYLTTSIQGHDTSWVMENTFAKYFPYSSYECLTSYSTVSR